MNFENQKEVLLAGMRQTGIVLSDDQILKFLDYYAMLMDWNQKMNLTAITDYEEVVMKHFVDSTSLLSVIKIPAQSSLIDVGTGAGFPGIPLKIVRPDLNVVLLDSLNKRVSFLNEVISSLKLDTENDITAIHGRAEDISREKLYRESFDFAVSRAVSNISVISEYCVPFLKVNGLFAAYKSSGITEELQQYGFGLEKLCAVIEKVETFEITGEKERAERSFVLIRKTGKTPDQYPRRSGIPEKRPLK